jgi:hypothetical protein
MSLKTPFRPFKIDVLIHQLPFRYSKFHVRPFANKAAVRLDKLQKQKFTT